MEKKSNILGQTSVVIDSYQKQGEVTPYYASKGDALFERLHALGYDSWVTIEREIDGEQQEKDVCHARDVLAAIIDEVYGG